MGYNCPICENELEIESIGDKKYRFICNNCDFGSSMPYPKTENKDEAYANVKKLAVNKIKEKDKVKKIGKRKKIVKELKRMLEPYSPHEEFTLPKSTPSTKDDSVGEKPHKKSELPIQPEDDREGRISDKKTVEFLKKISNVDDYNVVKTIPFESNEHEFVNIEKLKDVHPNLKKFITSEKKFEDGLYKHQVDSFNKITEKKNILITAPTASGKTESFLFPILNHIISYPQDESIVAAFVYPTKALAKDQSLRIKDYAEKFGVVVEIMDGDTIAKPDPETNVEDMDETKKIRLEILRRKPKILLTNFDFIHNRMWRKGVVDREFNDLFKNIKFLVIDEIHKYEGMHASHVHQIIQRMRRVYGKFTIIGASATIHDPKKFGGDLIGEPIEVINGKRRSGKLTLLILYPTKIGQKELMSDLTTKLLNDKHRVLCFSNSRMAAEEIAISVENKGGKIGVHRAGLLPDDREKVENEFKAGSLYGISATPTLEVGINIGDLDAVVSEYVPYQTLKQRIGRAGREGQDAYGFLILNPNDPISRFYYEHPDQYEFDNLDILLDPFNELIERIHIIFAAMDKPIADTEVEKSKEEEKPAEYSFEVSDRKYNSMQRQMQELIDHDILVRGDDGDYVVHPEISDLDLGNFSVRDIGMSVEIKKGDKKIGEWDIPMALEKLYKEAIYLHSKKVYRSIEFNTKIDKSMFKMLAKVREADNPKEVNTRTQPIVQKDYALHPMNERGEPLGEELVLDRIKTALWFLSINKAINEQYEYPRENKKVGRKVRVPTQLFGLRTTGIRIDFSSVSDQFRKIPEIAEDKIGVFHALEHLLIQSANMLAGGISGNLDGISKPELDVILIFDRSTNGGNGASKNLFLVMDEVFKRAYEIVNECDCKDGCPRCIHYNLCSLRNSNLNKPGAKSLLEKILGERRYKKPPETKDLV